MQVLATAAEMRHLDTLTIESYAIPGLVLMENAGRAFVNELEDRCDLLDGKTVVVICGKGNNGGDGFVIARHLVNKGCTVHVALLARKKAMRGDALTNMVSIQKMATQKGNLLHVIDVRSESQLRRLPKASIVVDALFGTGFTGSARGLYAAAIKWMNSQDACVASVDIASGVDATTGGVEGIAVNADLTVTMGLAKLGQFVGAGRDHSGDVRIVDISIPRAVLATSGINTYRVRSEDVASVLPRRPVDAHKYSVGKVFVLAGSRSFTGAPAMCARSVMRSGAGAVILGIPKSIHGVLARKLTEVIVTPLEETAEGTVGDAAIDEIREKIQWSDVVVIGPGLSRHNETDKLLQKLLPEIDRPVVLDADGLNAIGSNARLLKRRSKGTILTPHVGELRRLMGDAKLAVESDRIGCAREAAGKFRSIVVLKGAPTVTTTPGGEAFVNSTGNPGMATIGSGDILTGIVAGLMAQGMEAKQAAYAGVYVHGLAGDLAAKRYGERSMIAPDIQDCIAGAFTMLER